MSEPCPYCGGTIRDRWRAFGSSGAMEGEWVLGACDSCSAGSFAVVPSVVCPRCTLPDFWREWSSGDTPLTRGGCPRCGAGPR